MNGYDFDKTIYKGDSSTDFFVYMLFSRPYLLVFLPWFLIVLTLYGLKILSKKKTKEYLFFFVPWHKSIAKIVDKFWAKNANKIFNWYTKQKQDDDIIISASLKFIIEPVMLMLKIKNYYATEYNIKTGKIEGENCYGQEKVNRFNTDFKGVKLNSFYSDSLSDLPMFKQSETAFLVKKGNPVKIDISNL